MVAAGQGEERSGLAPALAVVAVGAGGAVGTALRYALSLALPQRAALPIGTLAANLIGAFALGALLEVLARTRLVGSRREAIRLALGSGVLGGFTTYSAFAVESALVLRGGSAVAGVGYAVLTVLLGIIASWFGILLAGRGWWRR